jgi:anti-anti-sigma factor
MNGSSKISITKVGPRTVLAPKEPLSHQSCEALEAAFRSCLTHPKVEILLDLDSVPLLDSEALELLLRMHEEMITRGSEIKIVNVNPLCRDIFIATRLLNVFSVFENVSEAIRNGS